MAKKYTKTILSGSTYGRAIKVVATATAGTLIHTGSSTAADLAEIWLWAINTDTTARKLTIEWGGVTSPDDLIELTVNPETGLVLVAPGILIKGNASTALIVRAFCATANVVCIHGFVNTIT